MRGKITWVCADAMEWLKGKRDVGAVVTGIADSNELGWTVEKWKPWFMEIARRCMLAATADAPCILCQTDRKADGGWVSKVHLMMQAADQAGARLLWHKVSLRRAPGTTDLYRPGYTNMMCFSRKGRPGKATPDVIQPGVVLWPNATNANAAVVALEFAKRSTNRVVDPFTGWGTIPHIAAVMGMQATAVDIDAAQIEKAKQINVEMVHGVFCINNKPLVAQQTKKDERWVPVLGRK